MHAQFLLLLIVNVSIRVPKRWIFDL